MRKLLLFLFVGLLSAQENPQVPELPQLKVGEFTIVGIDTFRAQRPIVDVSPGFKSYISVGDPDLVGFVSGQFPVNTFEISIEGPKERKSFFRSSLGMGYGNYLHLKVLAGKLCRGPSILGNIRISGPVGGNHGINTMDGFVSFNGKNGFIWSLTAGLFSKTEKASRGDTILTHKLFSPSIRGNLRFLPQNNGLFLLTRLDEEFVINDTGESHNVLWTKFNGSMGYIIDKPFKVSADLNLERLKSTGITSFGLGIGTVLGGVKSSLSAGLASSSEGKSSPVFALSLVFPFASNLKFGVKASKSLEIADFGLFETNSALIRDVSKPLKNQTSITLLTHYTTGTFALQLGVGYREYTSAPVLIRDSSKFWTLTSDTTSIKGASLEFSLYNYRHLSINGSYFLTSKEFSCDTLFLRGILGISYTLPEGRLIPGVRFGLSLANFNKRAVAQESFEVSKSFTKHVGAFIEVANPFKEGFEIFAPDYKINNGFSLALGLTMKF